MQQLPKQNAGFTLIELLVVTGITAMIMLTATSMFATFLLSSARTNARRQLQAEGNEAIRRIEFVIRNAAEVESDCDSAGTNLGTLTLRTLDNTTESITVSSNKLTIGGQAITSDNVRVQPLDGNPYFKCSKPGSGTTKYVDVYFRLNPAGGDYSTIAQDFKTTVQIRNTSFN